MLNKLVRVKFKRSAKRIGRGYGSGKGGHTVGRGAKGQKARNNVKVGFEGGQVPLYKRLPQIRGFKNPTRIDVLGIGVEKLNSFKEGSVVTPKSLIEEGIVVKIPSGGIKLLANGKLEKKLTLKGFSASEAAAKAIEKSGSLLE